MNHFLSFPLRWPLDLRTQKCNTISSFITHSVILLLIWSIFNSLLGESVFSHFAQRGPNSKKVQFLPELGFHGVE